MMDVIHIDEKWFYMDTNKRKFYLEKDEPDPLRVSKSKRFVPKIMFLAAVSRPQWDKNKRSKFNGKIGIWPLVTKEKAKRKSRNRDAGTLISKPLTSIDKNTMRKYLIEKVLPAIKENFPRAGGFFNYTFVQ